MSHSFSIKKAVYLALTALCAFMLAATVLRQAVPVEPTAVFSPEVASFGEVTDLVREPCADGSVRVTRTGEKPYIAYSAEGGDRVTVRLAEPLPEGAVAHLAFAIDHAFINDRVLPGVISDDRLLVTFYLPVAGPYNTFLFHINADYTLLSLTHEITVSPETAYTFNPIAAGALAVLLLLLALIEKKLRYFSFMRDFVKREFAFARSLSRPRTVVHALCVVCFLAFVGAAFADLLLSIVAPAYSKALAVLAALAIASVLTDLFYVRRKVRVALAFLLVTLILGTLFASTLPPTGVTSWDDEYHFSFIAGPASFLSGGSFSLGEMVFTAQLFRFPSFYDGAESYAASLLRLSSISANAYPLVLPNLHPALYVLLFPLLLIYAAFQYAAYLPGILTYTVGTWLGADIILRITAARLGSHLLFAAAFALAIHRLKYGKRLFGACALIPTTLYLSVSFSTDSFITSLVALGAAYFIGELQRPNEPITAKNAAIMVGATAIGCGPKAIYFILMLPTLFLPRRKFGSTRHERKYKLIFLAVILAVLLSFLVPFLINTDSRTDLRGGSDVSASGQIDFILSNPLAYTDILLRFLGTHLAFPNVTYNTSFFGYLGQGSVMLSTASILLLLFFAFTDRRREEGLDLSHKHSYRALSLLTVFAATVLVATALYVGFTPVGHETVLGCQFRYLFPLYPIFLYFLGATRVRTFMSERASAALALGGGALINLLVLAEVHLTRLQ